MHAAGYVLAGGRSTRMGRDKALLLWQGEPLLLHMIRLVESTAGNAVVLGPGSRYRSLTQAPCWDDLHPGLGPLGAIETALTRTESDWNLVVSIDIPALTPALLHGLLNSAAQTTAQAVIACDPGDASDPGGRVHPLCAVYHRSCLGTVQAAVRERDYRLMNLLKRLTIERLELPAPLKNLNCPDEWRLAAESVTP